MYADDLTISVTAPTAKEASYQLQPILAAVLNWAEKNNMDLSTKTEAILFTFSQTTPSDQEDLGLAFPTKSPVRLLGVTLDRALNWIQQGMSIKKVTNERTKQLSVLCGASWGPTPHDARTFLKGCVESAMLYASEVWWPRMSPTQKTRLETLHRAASRAVAGLVSSPDVAPGYKHPVHHLPSTATSTEHIRKVYAASSHRPKTCPRLGS